MKSITKKTTVKVCILLLCGFVLYSFSATMQDSEKWEVPAAAKKMKNPTTADNDEGWIAPKEADELTNPLKSNAEATAAGKKLYKTYCSVCHGDKGKGDGIAGLALKPPPADHSSENIQKQTDGAIYWKITEGKPPMVSYKLILTDAQRWQLVNYIRELGKTSKNNNNKRSDT